MTQMNLFAKQKQAHRHKKTQTYGYQRGKGSGGKIKQEFEINGYPLLYIKLINKLLLYIIGNCIQNLVITYSGKSM